MASFKSDPAYAVHRLVRRYRSIATFVQVREDGQYLEVHLSTPHESDSFLIRMYLFERGHYGPPLQDVCEKARALVANQLTLLAQPAIEQASTIEQASA